MNDALREAKMFDKLTKHPHVAQFFGIVYVINTAEIWLVTKYYENGSLKDYIKSRTKRGITIPLREKYKFI
eukprot:UN23540